jgi:hypothetical protein
MTSSTPSQQKPRSSAGLGVPNGVPRSITRIVVVVAVVVDTQHRHERHYKLEVWRASRNERWGRLSRRVVDVGARLASPSATATRELRCALVGLEVGFISRVSRDVGALARTGQPQGVAPTVRRFTVALERCTGRTRGSPLRRVMGWWCRSSFEEKPSPARGRGIARPSPQHLEQKPPFHVPFTFPALTVHALSCMISSLLEGEFTRLGCCSKGQFGYVAQRFC